MKLKPLVIIACILSLGLLGSFLMLCKLVLSSYEKKDDGTLIKPPATVTPGMALLTRPAKKPIQNNPSAITR